MDLNEVITKKSEGKEKLKNKYKLLQKHKSVGLIIISDDALLEKIIYAFKNIESSFIVDNKKEKIKKYSKNVFSGGVTEEDLIGFDFIVCCDDIEEIGKYLSRGIAPVIQKNNHLTSILKEFDPVKGSGNSYFYTKSNRWAIFTSVIKYLENFKFPYDNRNLVKNILEV